MAYIGKSPVIGNFVKLDAITAVNGQAAYTMQNGGSNFTDYESVNQFLVSLNGTIQAPTDSFTVSGSTLTFASNLSTGDVIDFIMVFGNSLSAGTPTDGTVSLAKLTATGTKDATTFLRGDNTFATPTDNGKVLQVVQTLKTDTESVTGTSFADITGLNVSITPSSSSNKVLIMLTMTFGGSGDIYPAFKLLRGTTTVTTATDLQGSATSATFGKNAYQSTNTENLSYTFLDSPSTTSGATTYKIQVRPMGTVSRTYYLNRPGDTGDSNRFQGTTTLTAMEISA